VAFAETQKLVVELDLKGNLNQKLGDAARALKGFDRATSNTQQSLSKFGRNLERGIVLGAAAAAGGFLAVAKAAGDFEAQMNTIATIVDRGSIAKIGEDLRKTARETGIGLDDLTTAYYDLASAGVKGQLATDALNDAVKLGIGGLATTAETVDLLTTAINAYHLDSIGAAKATDQFALAVADGKIKASEIAATFADVAAVANTYKIGIDQITASYAVLTAQGVPATEVTTEMQRAIISLINPTKELETAQKKLGISFTKEIATKGLVGALQELRVYSDKTGIPLIALLGRIEAVKYTLQTTGPNFRTYNAELVKMGNASGTAAAQMAERQQGLNFQLARLKALARDAGITIGSALLPKLTPLVEKLNAFISANQDKIADFGTKLADGFTKLADAIQKVDWTPFIEGLKLSADIAKTVIGAFRSLPEDLQKLVVAGFALNKVTGGLGTSIAKDIGGVLLNRFADRGSSATNPLWVTSVGGLPGAPGSLLNNAAKVIIPVAIAALTVEAAKTLTDAIDPGLAAAINDATGAHGTPLGQRDPQRFNQNGQVVQNVLPPPPATSGGLSPTERQEAHDAAQRLQDIKDADLSLVAIARESKAALVQKLDAIHTLFRTDLRDLITATKANDIAKAAKRVAADITKGVGNVDTTQRVLTELRKQLGRTHDPQLQATLRTAIAQVERKLPGRQFAASELAVAKGIFSDGKVTKQESIKLKSIMAALKDRGLPHAADVINKKIIEAKKAQVAAAAATTQSIKDKDLSVAVMVPLTNIVQVSGRDVVRTITKFSRYGLTQS